MHSCKLEGISAFEMSIHWGAYIRNRQRSERLWISLLLLIGNKPACRTWVNLPFLSRASPRDTRPIIHWRGQLRCYSSI